MKSNRHLGVSFMNGHIQLAEIEQGKKAAVTGLAEGQTNVDLVQAGVHLSAEHPQVATLVGELRDLMKRNKIGAKAVSFALPADPVFVNIIPVDPALEGQALSQYLQWEVRQYFPEASPKDFIVDSHPLPASDKSQNPRFLVAVRRGMVGFLQKVTNELKLQLQVIDIDHLSTEKTLSYNYPEISGHNAALFCVRMTGMIGSIICNGEIIDYRMFNVDIPADISKTVSVYLKHLKQNDLVAPPEALFLYGMNIPQEMVQQIREETETQTIVVNSLRKIPVVGKVYEQFAKESNRFASAIGLGLRTS